MNKIKTILFKQSERITTPRIAILGIFVSLIITLKYVLGFVPGVELVTFMFIIMGIFLPIFDLILLVTSFNLLVLVIYGFGTWWLVYWIIWPIDALISKMVSKTTKNRFVMGVVGFILGFSIIFWYFLSSLLFYGPAKAILDLISALPINLIEGFTTMFCIIIIGPQLIKILNYHSHKFWGKNRHFEFNEIKKIWLGYSMVGLLSIGSIVGIITLFAYNHKFLLWKEQHIKKSYSSGLLKPNNSSLGVAPYGKGDVLLTTTSYNDLYKSLEHDQVGLVVIANGKSYIEKISYNIKETIYNILLKSKKFVFNFYHHISNGAWIKTFKLKEDIKKFKNKAKWRHGTSINKNYGDYYPIYYINHKIASLGVSNWHIKPQEIYEITYDHNS